MPVLMYKKLMYRKVADYIKISEDLRRKIQSGFYATGDFLPSQRALAKQYNVSRFTVSQALEILEYVNIVEISHGKGCIVTGDSAFLPDWRSFIRTGMLPNFSWNSADIAGNIYSMPSKMQGISSDFGAESLICEASERALKRLFDPENYDLMELRGISSLRREYIGFLKKAGVNASMNEILITSGLEQAVATASQGLFSPSFNLLYASPSIYNSIAKFRNTGVNMIPVQMDDEGITADGLLKHAKIFDKSFLYLEPAAQEPEGISISQKRREELVKVLEKTSMPVIENDHRRQLWEYSGERRTFKEMMPDKVIYIDASLKVLFPNLQIAAVVAPEFIISRLEDIKMQQDYYTSSINQLIAEEVFLSGRLDEFFVNMQSGLALRRDKMDELLRVYLGEFATWNKPQAGLYYWLNFSKINTYTLSRKIKDDPRVKLRTVAGSAYIRDDIHHLLISYANVDMEQAENSLDAMRELVSR